MARVAYRPRAFESDAAIVAGRQFEREVSRRRVRTVFWLGRAESLGATAATFLLFTRVWRGAPLTLPALTTACTILGRLLHRSARPAGVLARRAGDADAPVRSTSLKTPS